MLIDGLFIYSEDPIPPVIKEFKYVDGSIGDDSPQGSIFYDSESAHKGDLESNYIQPEDRPSVPYLLILQLQSRAHCKHAEYFKQL